MYIFLLILILVAAVLLVLAVLAQSPKGSGLSGQFGGSSVTQLMGVKKTTDILEKITWIMATIIIVLAVVTNIMLNKAVVAEDAPTASPNLEEIERTPSFAEEELPFLDGAEQNTTPARDTAALDLEAFPE